MNSNIITNNKTSISYQSAIKLVDLCISKAQKLHIEISVSIVDCSGLEIVFCKMDNAPLLSVSVAKKKAFSAISYNLETGEKWWNFIKEDPLLLNSIPHLNDFTILGGGKPIKVNEKIIGAIGVSGGHYNQDIACIDYAFETLEISK